MFKKFTFRTAAIFLAAVLLLLPVKATPENSARSCILIDADTDRVIYENCADTRSLIASTTKIMTAMVVLEHQPLNKTFIIPPEATNIEGSSMYLKAGECLTVEELLYGMMLHSGNDAAIALALLTAGNVEEFVVLMNLKAQKLGLKQTHFENPNGLDGDQHYSTARDLAKLTQYALQNEDFCRIVSTKSIQAAGRSLRNHNRLLWLCDGCIGVKTGYTKAAGRILVSAARRNGRCLIAVTICDGNDWQDHLRLYDYGFGQYQNTMVIEENEIVAQMPMMDGSTLPLKAGESLELFLCENETIEVRLEMPQFAFVKGEEGSYAAQGGVYLGTKKIAQIPLLWG
ncbi:MAG: D-alanyl-D-alanine carboxypeptidase [Ruminococcaceae bacterium]|nr:D-alanyl-D-alanine carboxypeptidase [Oscillospiraceae bacterium]